MDPVLVGFISYLVLVLLVGLATWRLNRTGEDYLLAGRRLPTWVAALSERASGESAWLLLGLPGAVLTTGLVEIWSVAGCFGPLGPAIRLSWCVSCPSEAPRQWSRPAASPSAGRCWVLPALFSSGWPAPRSGSGALREKARGYPLHPPDRSLHYPPHG